MGANAVDRKSIFLYPLHEKPRTLSPSVSIPTQISSRGQMKDRGT